MLARALRRPLPRGDVGAVAVEPREARAACHVLLRCERRGDQSGEVVERSRAGGVGLAEAEVGERKSRWKRPFEVTVDDDHGRPSRPGGHRARPGDATQGRCRPAECPDRGAPRRVGPRPGGRREARGTSAITRDPSPGRTAVGLWKNGHSRPPARAARPGGGQDLVTRAGHQRVAEQRLGEVSLD